MNQPDYRPAQRKLGRRLVLAFEVVNTFSFSLLAGNLITLLLLRLGANSTLIGILAAFPYIAFFFMPLAKGSVVKNGLVKTFGRAWTARYLVVIPIVFAPLLVVWNLHALGIGLVLVSFFLFQVMRGFGLVSVSPLNNELSAGKDRGEFLSRKMMFTYGSSIVAGVVVAIFLGSQAPLERYSLFMGIGIILGFIGCALLFRIPEPPGGGFGAMTSFRNDITRGLADGANRRFFLAIAVMFFVANLSRPFLIVYAKQACNFGDDAAMVLTVIGNLGAIAMGWLCRMVLDRMGAKPMLVIFAILMVASSFPLVFMTPPGGLGAWVMLSILFFVSTFAATGGENASQAWFFIKTEPELQFNMGMFYYMVMGLAGALGSFLGGLLLDGATQFVSPLVTLLGRAALPLGFNAFFALALALGVPVVILLARIAPLGARPVVDTLSTIFSLRDLQTISTLRRLDSPSGIEDEERMLALIRESDSDLAVEEVLKRLSSPLFAIRNQALLILERLPMTMSVEDALIDQVRNHQFASAYRAARILGQKGVFRAAPTLRSALASGDYFLQAWAAAALGDLKDQDSRVAIEHLLSASPQTLVIIHCLVALKHLAQTESYPVVMAVLARREVPAHLRDEVVFGLAGIAGIANWLYPKYLAFLEDAERGVAHLLDELDLLEGPLHPDLPALLEQLVQEDSDFAPIAQRLLLRLEKDGQLPKLIAAETRRAIGDPALSRFIRFRFYVAGLIVQAFGTLSRSMSR